MALERTLIILKPDAVQRNLCGEIICRFEKKGLQIVGMKMMKISPQLAETHYESHRGKPFYAGLVKFMTSSPVIVLALAGKDAIAIARGFFKIGCPTKREAVGIGDRGNGRQPAVGFRRSGSHSYRNQHVSSGEQHS